MLQLCLATPVTGSSSFAGNEHAGAGTVDPLISEPFLSEHPDYPNIILLRFIRLDRIPIYSNRKYIVSHIRTFHIPELPLVPWCSDMRGSTVSVAS